jgi:hypothetical protein
MMRSASVANAFSRSAGAGAKDASALRGSLFQPDQSGERTDWRLLASQLNYLTSRGLQRLKQVD